MNKIKQNKITFSLILASIIILFSSLTILCLPVLFNYKSKVATIENHFYKNFKIYINTNGKISYKPFPKPHLLVENASLNLSNSKDKDDLLNTTNLKIFMSLREIYLRTFKVFTSLQISKANLEFEISDIKEFRKHLYEKVNKPIIFKDCKIFVKNEKKEVILISPTKKIFYNINNKTKIKNFIIDGKIFGLDYNSEWKRNYLKPNISTHKIDIINPNIEIKNNFEFEDSKLFSGKSRIVYLKDKMEYFMKYNDGKITISSPNKEKTNFNLDSKIQLNPFYFEGELIIKNKKIENIIDGILLNLFFYDENYLGNLNGLFKIKFNDLNNKLLQNGEFSFLIKEKKIFLKNAKFELNKIGYIDTNIRFVKNNGDIKFVSENKLIIQNHIEFAKVFQISSKKIKKIKYINFDIEKNFGESDFIITNVKINKTENIKKVDEIFIIKNIQSLRSHIRKVVN